MKKENLLKEINLKEVKLTASQKEEFIASLEEAIKKFVNEGERVKLGELGTFIKKHKNERHNPERTVKLHGVEKHISASVTPAKDVLAFESKIEFK